MSKVRLTEMINVRVTKGEKIYLNELVMHSIQQKALVGWLEN